MPKKPLAHRLYNDPAYAEIARRVGYLGTDYPLSREETDRLAATHGKEKLVEAAGELIDYDTASRRATLKPGVRRLCRPIMGPAPEEWEQFYAGIENPPPNPYLAKQPPAETAEPKKRRKPARAKRSETKAEGQPPENLQDKIRGLTGAELMRWYFAAKRTFEETAKDSELYAPARAEYRLLKVECKRRGFNLPPTADDVTAEEFASESTSRLRDLLDRNRHELSKYPPGSVMFEEAERDIGFIEAELGRRQREPQGKGGGR